MLHWYPNRHCFFEDLQASSSGKKQYLGEGMSVLLTEESIEALGKNSAP
jgi:hypothetical protein